MNKLNKTIILLSLFLVLNAYFVFAIDDTYKAGEDFDLKRPCWNNGSYCSASAICNLTIWQMGNGSSIINDAVMTNQVSFHNYTLSILEVGEYQSQITCVDGADNGFETFKIKITPTGDVRDIDYFIFLAIASVIVLAIGYFLENEYIGFLAGILFLITGIYSMIYGISDLADFYTRAVALISVGLGIIFIIASAYSMIYDSDDNEIASEAEEF